MILSVSVREFPEEVSIWVGRLSKDHQCGSATSKPLKTWIEWKDRGRVKLGDPSSPAFGRWCSWFLGFLTQTELHHCLSWFSRLQTEDCGTSQPQNSCESIAVKKKKKSLLAHLHICIYTYLVSSVFLKILTNIGDKLEIFLLRYLVSLEFALKVKELGWCFWKAVVSSLTVLGKQRLTRRMGLKTKYPNSELILEIYRSFHLVAFTHFGLS